MSHLVRDLRLAWRSARRQPGTSLIVILTLAVGIGANTAIFTYLQELYWLGSPVPDAERVFSVRTGTDENPQGGASYLDSIDYREAAADLGEMVIRGGFGAVVALPDGRTSHQIGMAVSADYFDLFRTRMTHGRTFLPEEDAPGGPPVVVVSHVFWNRYLGADPEVVGRSLRLNSIPFAIIGVTPESFRDFGQLPHVFVPAQRIDDIVPRESLADRDARRFSTFLRLHDGVTREAAQERFDRLAERLDEAFPWPRGRKRHIKLRGLNESTSLEAGELMMAGAVGLLLLLACANVANLLLARASGRQREMAVLGAIGASRRRIAARLLTENLLLAVAGGVIGIFLSRQLLAFMKSLLELLPLGLPNWGEGHEWLELDLRVLLFTLALSLLTGCLFGLAPILYATRSDLVSALKGAAFDRKPGRRIGPRQALVVAQVLLSTVLLLISGLLIRSLDHLRGRELGYDTDRQLLVALSTAPARSDSAVERRAEERRLLGLAQQRLANLAQVEAAALASQIPGGGIVLSTRLELGERPSEDLEVDLLAVGEDFFRAFDIALVRGRGFEVGDRAGAPGVAMVNRAFAERFWDGADPIGRELRLPDYPTDAATEDRFLVVGQVADTRHASRRDEPTPLVYVPFRQAVQRSRVFAVARIAGPPRAAVQAVRDALADAHPALAMLEVDTYDRLVTFDLYEERLYSGVAGLFSLFGLGLAGLGIYSVMSFSVISRLRELAIRMAVGATRRQLVQRVLGEAFSLVAAGIVLGVLAALVLARLLSSLLHGVAPHDPGSFLTLPLVLATIGVAAAWVPAWRAGRTDPNVALRED